MNPSKLISIGLFTIALVLTLYAWSDRITGRNKAIEEAFANPDKDPLSDTNIQALIKGSEPEPTDADAIAAHQTLLRYIRNDFKKGIYFVIDLRNRFFGDNVQLRDDLDVRRLMDNYISPLQGI